MVFIGYEQGSKAYRLYDPSKRNLVVSRDVVFEEDRCWDWQEGAAAASSEEATFTVHYPARGADVEASPITETGEVAVTPTTPQTAVRTCRARDTEEATPSIGTPVQQTPVPMDTLESPWTEPSEGPQGKRSLNDIYDDSSEIDMPYSGLCLLGTGEPSTFAKAEKQACWQRAMKEEMDSIVSNNTLKMCELPKGQKPIGLKWIYKLKKDSSRNVVKHKARLVAKGYVQRQGIDFDEVFAPVARMETVRLLLALAANEGWEIHHMDVKSAFLNGELEEEVYVAQPSGFVVEGEEHKVLKLHKALYGLRQAPRAWNAKLDRTLFNLDFEKCPSEPALYKRNKKGAALLVGVYVDDLVITRRNVADIEAFKVQMKSLFSMSDLGLLSYYLGIEVKQTPQGIYLNQSSYASRILEKCGMKDCNPGQTPMEPRLKLSKMSKAPTVDCTYHRSVVGSLRYLLHTRPDLCYSVGLVSRYMERPTAEHMTAVKHILRYIRGTLKFGCFYEKGRELQLVGYCDSDHAGDVDDRKSTSGLLFYLGSSPISWVSQKQKMVAISSCEAEYMAATSGACQSIWLARLLAEILDSEPAKVKLKVDNQSAISLSKNPVFHDRSKHIDLRYHFVRECVEAGKVDISHVRTEDQLADILTKSLGRAKFQELRSAIGVKEVT